VSNISIKTDRLCLQKLKLEDAQTVFLYRSNYAVSRYQSFHPKNINDVVYFINKNTQHIDIDNTWYQFGIYLHSGELIGDFGVHFIDKQNGICEIGYTIRPEYQRKGYGKEAAIGVLKHLFGQMEKSEIIASIDPRNEPSKKMLESLGFSIKKAQMDDIEYALVKENFRLTIAST